MEEKQLSEAGYSFDTVSDKTLQFKMLRQGRADLIYLNVIEANLLSQAMNIPIRPVVALPSQPVWVLCNKSSFSEKQKKRLKEARKSLMESGELGKI